MHEQSLFLSPTMEKIIFRLVAPYCDLKSLTSFASVNKVAKTCEDDMMREYVYARYDERSVVNTCIRNKIVNAKLVHDLEKLQDRMNRVRQLLDIFRLFATSPEVTMFDVRKTVAEHELEAAIEWVEDKELEETLEDTYWTPLRVLYHVYFEDICQHFEGPIRMYFPSAYVDQLVRIPQHIVHRLHVKLLLSRTVTPDQLSIIDLNHARVVRDI